MLNAAVKALSQILSPPMRSILWRSIGLALVLATWRWFRLLDPRRRYATSRCVRTSTTKLRFTAFGQSARAYPGWY